MEFVVKIFVVIANSLLGRVLGYDERAKRRADDWRARIEATTPSSFAEVAGARKTIVFGDMTIAYAAAIVGMVIAQLLMTESEVLRSTNSLGPAVVVLVPFELGFFVALVLHKRIVLTDSRVSYASRIRETFSVPYSEIERARFDVRRVERSGVPEPHLIVALSTRSRVFGVSGVSIEAALTIGRVLPATTVREVLSQF